MKCTLIPRMSLEGFHCSIHSRKNAQHFGDPTMDYISQKHFIISFLVFNTAIDFTVVKCLISTKSSHYHKFMSVRVWYF